MSERFHINQRVEVTVFLGDAEANGHTLEEQQMLTEFKYIRLMKWPVATANGA